MGAHPTSSADVWHATSEAGVAVFQLWTLPASVAGGEAAKLQDKVMHYLKDIILWHNELKYARYILGQ